jgi:hypothetical protein
MAAQNRAQAGPLLTPKLPMVAHRTHPLPVAAVVENMPAASRMVAVAVEDVNHLLLNEAAG